MFLVVRAKRIFLVLCLTIAAIGGIIIYSNRTLVPVFRMGAEAAAVYIIDAGHGGEDGGAVAQDGTVESDLNLAVARRVEGVLAFAGKKTVMTRRNENAVYDEGSATLREKKRSDLKNRAAQINRYDDAYLISIHQNSLPAVPSVHGAQVFYNAANGAETMAGAVQEALNQAVNQGNEKNEKAIEIIGVAGAQGLVDGALDIVVGHVHSLGLGDNRGQAGVVVRIAAAALFDGHDDLTGDLRKSGTALCIGRALRLLNIVPFRMSGHK